MEETISVHNLPRSIIHRPHFHRMDGRTKSSRYQGLENRLAWRFALYHLQSSHRHDLEDKTF